VREDYVGPQIGKLFCDHSHPINVFCPPPNIELHVTASRPTQVRKSLRQPGEHGLSLRIAFVPIYEHANPPHPVGLLRTRRMWPQGVTAGTFLAGGVACANSAAFLRWSELVLGQRVGG
jgi:hypothetical protein